MQEIGETREPMAFDCWADANRLAESYAKKMNRDFWILFCCQATRSSKECVGYGMGSYRKETTTSNL